MEIVFLCIQFVGSMITWIPWCTLGASWFQIPMIKSSTTGDCTRSHRVLNGIRGLEYFIISRRETRPGFPSHMESHCVPETYLD